MWKISLPFFKIESLGGKTQDTTFKHRNSIEGQVFGGNHSEIGTNDQKSLIWPRNDRNNFLMIVEISQAVMVLDTS
jgi:hypothetical protein